MSRDTWGGALALGWHAPKGCPPLIGGGVLLQRLRRRRNAAAVAAARGLLRLRPGRGTTPGPRLCTPDCTQVSYLPPTDTPLASKMKEATKGEFSFRHSWRREKLTVCVEERFVRFSPFRNLHKGGGLSHVQGHYFLSRSIALTRLHLQPLPR